MKQVPIPPQPKDRNDPLYKMIAEFINYGDVKVWAVELDLKSCTVSNAVNGNIRSKKVWDHIMKAVLKRKEQKQIFLEYMSK